MWMGNRHNIIGIHLGHVGPVRSAATLNSPSGAHALVLLRIRPSTRHKPALATHAAPGDRLLELVDRGETPACENGCVFESTPQPKRPVGAAA